MPIFCSRTYGFPRNFARPVNIRAFYQYNASGEKLRKIYLHKNPEGSGQEAVTTDYLNGFQYESKQVGSNTAAVILKFVPTSEGYYNFENNKYIYSYTDHLGNIRVSYFKNTNGSAEVLEENNFYPFGMKHEGYNQTTGNPSYNYQYSGKELQKETGWSDFGARMYMSDIARWGVIDPLAETTTRVNPYNYALNNPVMFIDPDGRKAFAPEPVEDNVPRGGLADFYLRGGNGSYASYNEFLGNDMLLFYKGANGAYGGGGSSPTFQFPKGTEEYYKKNYPAFYNLVKNILPNILKDPNYLKALMDVTGMSKETLEKAFNYGGDSPIIHADYVWGDGFYDYSGSHAKEDLNTVSVDIDKVLNWYEKANKDPNTIAGVANIFYMTAVVGHEAAHWGNQIKGPTGEGLNFLHNFNNLAGEPEHGNAFEFKLLNGLYPNAKVGNFLYIGHASSGLSQYLNNYVSTNFKMLSNIFKQK